MFHLVLANLETSMPVHTQNHYTIYMQTYVARILLERTVSVYVSVSNIYWAG